MMGALKNFDDTDDDEEKKLAAEKGYKGLTFNVSVLLRGGGEWRKDDKVINGNFLEILAMPLAIGAIMYDMSQEGIKGPQLMWKGTVEGFTQMVDAVMDIPGLQQVGQIYEAFANNRNPDDALWQKLGKSLGQFVTNTSTSYVIPNIVSQATAGWDNKQRDIYGTDRYIDTLRNIWMAKIPGLRQKLPEKTDTFGETRTYGDNRLMALVNTILLPGDIKKYHVSELEEEILRLKKDTGYSGTLFDTNATRTIEFEDKDYSLDADQRRAYHETKAQYLIEAYSAFVQSDEYQNLTDDQRLGVLLQLRTNAEHMTKNGALKLAGIDEEALNKHLDKWERELTTWDKKIQYLSAKQEAVSLWDKDEGSVTDFAAMDKFITGDYKALSEEQKKILDGSYSHLDDLANAAKNGITSEKWQIAYNIYQKYTVEDEDGKRVFKSDLKNSSEMWSRIQKATGFADGGKEMRWLEENMRLTYTGSPNTETYDELVYDYGLSRESAAKIYGKTSTLQPTNGYSEVQDRQKWVALTECGLSDKEQWDSFFAMVPSNNTNQIRNMQRLHGQVNPRTGKLYTFQEAIHKLELDVIYWKEVLPNGKTKKHRMN